MPRDWRLVNSLIRREQLLMPSDGLRSQLAESLESLPRHVVRNFLAIQDIGGCLVYSYYRPLSCTLHCLALYLGSGTIL